MPDRQSADTELSDRHVAVGHLVLTVIGNDGVRWACETCNGTVFQCGADWFHFDKSRDLNRPGQSDG